MTLHSRSLRTTLWRTATATLLCLLTAHAQAQAQVRWVVDAKGSLAWWQVDPHMNHLWATTCPQEPTWKVGEGHSTGWTNQGAVEAAGESFANVSDTIHVPRYPRPRIRAFCNEALRGQIVLPDTVGWRGAHGEIVVKADRIFTGMRERDAYMHNAVLSVLSYPELKFVLDSLVDMRRSGDTLWGTAMGVFYLRDKSQAVSAAVQAYPISAGIRVFGKFRLPVMDLIKNYGVSRRAMGLGIVLNIWKTMFIGVDMLVRPEKLATGTD